MKHIFEDPSLKILEAFCYGNSLFAFDYDGTLTPIVDDASSAHLPERTRRLLEQLADYAPIAIISGRKRGDVLGFVGGGVDFVIGNHGLEGLPSGLDSIEAAQKLCTTWHEELVTELCDIQGIWIENKTYSLALHYRKASDRKATRSAILESAVNLSPAPRIVMGKLCVNLMPAGAPHKGVALLEVMLKTGCRSAVYIGDDDNDEDVFRLAEENLLTIRVGQKTDSGALFFVKDQNAVDLVLEKCVTFMDNSGKARRR